MACPFGMGLKTHALGKGDKAQLKIGCCYIMLMHHDSSHACVCLCVCQLVCVCPCALKVSKILIFGKTDQFLVHQQEVLFWGLLTLTCIFTQYLTLCQRQSMISAQVILSFRDFCDYMNCAFFFFKFLWESFVILLDFGPLKEFSIMQTCFPFGIYTFF